MALSGGMQLVPIKMKWKREFFKLIYFIKDLILILHRTTSQ